MKIRGALIWPWTTWTTPQWLEGRYAWITCANTREERIPKTNPLVGRIPNPRRTNLAAKREGMNHPALQWKAMPILGKEGSSR